MNKVGLIFLIEKAFEKLIEFDAKILGFDIEPPEVKDKEQENPPAELSRKLHEVCINHRLACYFNELILPKIPQKDGDRFFIDLEFNKNGIDEKETLINKELKRIRPDIIIHNRKDGD